MHTLDIENLHKSFDGLPVLRGLSLQVPAGQIYGLLGQTGAGKTTLLHLLLGLIRPYRGAARVLGAADPAAARGRVGYLPQRGRYHLRFTAREYLRYLGQFDGLRGAALHERIEAELRAVGLHEAADRLLSSYTKGMVQRLGLAQALLNSPPVVLLDEPTAGLDPLAQREMLDLLGGLRPRGTTILITSQFVPEIEFLCDRVGVLHGGRLAADLDAQTLRAPGRSATITVDALPPALAAQLSATPGVRCAGRAITLQPNSPALQARVLRALLDADVTLVALESQRRPLEELFTQIVRGERPELSAPPEPPATGLFAPPRHPDTPAPLAAPEHSANGDTLLHQLLGQEKTD